jgi:DEAD/DEAH box helicase domain-containing protein
MYFTTMKTEVIFDVETKRLFNEISTDNPGDLGISIACAYQRQVDDFDNELNGKMYSFWENELDGLWPILTSADRLIGFNSIKFDIPALSPYANGQDFSKIAHLDILVIVRESLGRSISLNSLVTETLGKAKIDDGVNAVTYWNSQIPENLEKLKLYCEEDVILTRDLYDYGFKNNFIYYKDKWDSRKQIAVNFKYPEKEASTSNQIGLF